MRFESVVQMLRSSSVKAASTLDNVVGFHQQWVLAPLYMDNNKEGNQSKVPYLPRPYDVDHRVLCLSVCKSIIDYCETT